MQATKEKKLSWIFLASSTLFVFETDFDANGFRRVHTRVIAEHSFKGQSENYKSGFDLAGAIGSSVGPSRKLQKIPG